LLKLSNYNEKGKNNGFSKRSTDKISDWNAKREAERQEKERARQEKRKNDALNYIENERVKCDSEIDFETMKFVVDSFTDREKIAGYSSISIDGNSGNLDNDAAQYVDANMYRFCKAIISQNFMLMRKIDALSEKIEAIEKREEQSEE